MPRCKIKLSINYRSKSVLNFRLLNRYSVNLEEIIGADVKHQVTGRVNCTTGKTYSQLHLLMVDKKASLKKGCLNLFASQ